MSTDLGIKNKFFDKRRAEARRWSTIEQPAVYICATLAAICVYVGITLKDSLIEQNFNATNEALIELGERGLYTSVLEAVPIEPYALKVVTVVVGSILLLIGIKHVALSADQRIEDIEAEA